MLPRLTRALWLLLAVGVVLRLVGLDRLPGVNADETWLAVQVQHLLRGEPFALRTPTHMFVNPLLVATEAAVLQVLPPSGWALRLPIALWGLAGLALLYRLTLRLWSDRTDALLVTALVATMPIAVAYGHCAWDPSFLPVVAPLVWLPALHALDTGRWRLNGVLLLLGVVLSLWVHMTVALMLAALGLGLWRVKSPPRKVTWLLAGGAVLAIAVLTLVGGLGTPMLSLLIERPIWLASHPASLIQVFAVPGLLLTGGRAFGYFAGMPETWPVWLAAVLVTVGLTVLAWRLRLSEQRSDRWLAWSWLLLPLPWGIAAGILMPQGLGRERYVVWLVIPAALLLVRGLRAWRPALLAIVVASALMSALWLVALDQQPWPDTVHRAFRTGPVEPKEALAQQLIALAPPGRPLRVAVPDWWLEHPLHYLLPPGSEVAIGLEQPNFTVVWSDGAGRSYPDAVYDRHGRAILAIVPP